MRRALLACAFALGCAPKTGKLRVDWSFAGQSCARASVIFVRAELEAEPAQLLPCSDDNSRLGGTLDKLPPGLHHLRLHGLGVGGADLWAFEQDGVEISVGQTSTLQADFTRTATENPLQPTTPAVRQLEEPPPE